MKRERVSRNVTLDDEVAEGLNRVQSELEERLGFRPSLNQCLLFLLKQVDLGGSTTIAFSRTNSVDENLRSE